MCGSLLMTWISIWMSQNGLKTLSSNWFCCIQHYSHLRSTINVETWMAAYVLIQKIVILNIRQTNKNSRKVRTNSVGFKSLRKILTRLSPGFAPHESSSHCLTTGWQHKWFIQNVLHYFYLTVTMSTGFISPPDFPKVIPVPALTRLHSVFVHTAVAQIQCAEWS